MTVFNRNLPFMHRSTLEDPSQNEIKGTPSLWNASLDDASRFGGELTRYLLSEVPLKGDRRYVTVDTKIHMLMKGMYPGIPGWHTDGVPRHLDGSPASGGPPIMDLQESLDAQGRAPRFHLLVTGSHCPTEFATDKFGMDVPGDPNNLYKALTERVEHHGVAPSRTFTNPSQWVSWDWWNVHRARPADNGGWRMLIRVTESDFLPPQTNLRDIIRLHNPVYMPVEYGW